MKQVLINHRKLVCQEYVDTSLYVCAWALSHPPNQTWDFFFTVLCFLFVSFFRRRTGSKTKEGKGVMVCQRLAVTPTEPFAQSLAKSVENF